MKIPATASILITDATFFEAQAPFLKGLGLISPKDKESVLKYKNEKVRAKSLCGKLLLRFGYACYKYKEFMTMTSEKSSFIFEGCPSKQCQMQYLSVFEGGDKAGWFEGLTYISPEKLIFERENEGIHHSFENYEEDGQKFFGTSFENEIPDGILKIPEIVEKPGGKPCFKGNEGIFFNISHSGDLCGICISENECGFDLQEFCHFSEGVFKRVINVKEEGIDDEIPSWYKKNQSSFKALYNLDFGLLQKIDFMKENSVAAKNAVSDEGYDANCETERGCQNAKEGSFKGNSDDITHDIFENIAEKGRLSLFFFLNWSCKEAYVKLTGNGLGTDFTDIEYDIEKGCIKGPEGEAVCSTMAALYKDKYYSFGVAFWK